MKPPRVAFFGSPEFAVPTLHALIESAYQPVLVIAQPDRPAGRGRILRPPPVKALALAAGIPIMQPERLRDPVATAAVAAGEPELQIICAYGQILRREVLDLPRHGTLNVHASLLPRWRGAAPIAAAIQAGDTETGATIMLVDKGEDTGGILTSRREPIQDSDDSGQLNERLARLGAALLLETIPRWLAGEITPQPQDERLATRAPRLKKEDGRIDWTQSAVAIWRQVRAFSPWPGASTTLDGVAVRIQQASPAERGGDAPGTVRGDGDTIAVQTGDGILHIERLQRAGRRTLSAAEFTRGERHLTERRFS